MDIELLKNKMCAPNGEPNEEFMLSVFELIESSLKKDKFKKILERKRQLTQLKEKELEVKNVIQQYGETKKEVNAKKNKLKALEVDLKKQLSVLKQWTHANEIVTKALGKSEAKDAILERIEKIKKTLKQVSNNLKIVDGKIVEFVKEVEEKLPNDLQN